MKKKYVFLAIIVLLIVITAIVYSQVKKTGQLPIVSNQNLTWSLRELIAQKNSLKCTWKNDDKNSGTVYLKDGKYYGEVTVDGIGGFIIMVDKCLWSWDRQGVNAVKSCFDKFPLEVQSEDVQRGFPEATYNCERVEVPDTRFLVPAEVEFRELN